jgi:hypothetical protein
MYNVKYEEPCSLILVHVCQSGWQYLVLNESPTLLAHSKVAHCSGISVQRFGITYTQKEKKS